VVPQRPAIEELKDTKFIDLTQTQLHVIEKGK
jgi:hypothetical protein